MSTGFAKGMALSTMISSGNFGNIEDIVGSNPAICRKSESPYEDCTKEEVIEELKKFKSAQVIPCDVPREAVSGFAIFNDEEGQFVAIGERFAKPALPENTIVLTEEAADAETIVERCIAKQWKRCDDAKLLTVGFIDYAPLDSDGETLLTMCGLSAMKRFSSRNAIIKQYLEKPRQKR
jgi:hypothetical protein